MLRLVKDIYLRSRFPNHETQCKICKSIFHLLCYFGVLIAILGGILNDALIGS